MPPIVVCSTGLSRSERKKVEETVHDLGGVYNGDLTDRTNVLVVKSGAVQETEKIRVARSLGLPVVSVAWLTDSAATGSGLRAPDEKYAVNPPVAKGLPTPGSDENTPLNAPRSATTAASSTPEDVCNFEREPLSLLHDAIERGELSLDHVSPPRAETAVFRGKTYALDAPTGFLRHPTTATRPGHGHSPASGSRPYTLRELIFGLRCARHSHANYFLECVTHGVEPVLLLDKKKLLAAVLPGDGGGNGGSGDGVARLMDQPLCQTTLSAIGTQGQLVVNPPSHTISESDRAVRRTTTTPPSAVVADERSLLLTQLREAAEERARLNAQVSSLSAKLREERSRAESAASQILAL
jgi:hypothetical protein